jgi:serine/threonine protein kinase
MMMSPVDETQKQVQEEAEESS